MVGKLAYWFRLVGHCGEQDTGIGLALLIESTNQVMGGFPYGVALVGLRIPANLVFRPAQQTHLASAGLDDSGFCDASHTRALAAREHVGLAERTSAPTVLLEPTVAEQSIG